MKIFEKKYILPVLFFIISVFLFAPVSKVRAVFDHYNCTNTVNNKCVDFPTSTQEFDENAAILQCNSICTTPILGGTWTKDCSWYPDRCPTVVTKKVYSCTNNDKCIPITEDDNQAGEQRVLQQCSDICGVSVDLIHRQNGGCIFDNEPCPSASGPLAGASVESLKTQAGSLNKLGITEPSQLVGRFIQILMAFIGSIALALYVWSGFMWMTASGNADRVSKAKTTMVWTTLGVLMMLASYMLASFLFKSLGL